MITPDSLTDEARTDGDTITVAALRDLRGQALQPPPAPPASGVTLTSRPPLLVARPTLADHQVRAATRIWLASRAGHHRANDPAEEALLHAVETSALARPPIDGTAATVDADLADIYLTLARHWLELTKNSADPRYLNAALKLLSICLVAPVPASEQGATTLAATLEALDTTTVPPTLSSSIARRHAYATPVVPAPTGAPEPRIAVLAGADSRGLPQFLAAAHNLPITGVVLHEGGQQQEPPGSAYGTPWYPATRATHPRLALAASPLPHHRVAHRDWNAAAAHLADWGTDLLVLIGMDVIPPTVLAVPLLGTINAHNGALPAYRGMDAVAWAVLTGQPVVCSVHHVTEQVDAGHVLATSDVPTDAPDLRQAVKDTQLRLLTDVCRHVATTGALPAGQPQTGPTRRYYRMHPALRHLLDAATNPIGAAS
ncbi:formyltransferase family protein [Kitasatospora purpeofusca]|uniref:formyltransferase family protein n=1 Tax=Kitasatospora purpeofusca TaxID=67352 RepID=UPI002E104EB4|nr:formyltransferase family protein [Kitasatospora purpeofusca]WSR40187.1 formyltransferase family protein [Kitasatospora purpeofusca]